MEKKRNMRKESEWDRKRFWKGIGKRKYETKQREKKKEVGLGDGRVQEKLNILNIPDLEACQYIHTFWMTSLNTLYEFKIHDVSISDISPYL